MPVLLIFSIMASGCATVDYDVPKDPSKALAPSQHTNLGKTAKQWSDQHGGKSGFIPLVDASDALGARLELARLAQKTLDIQYFLMKDDDAGAVITQAMLQAADRGVRVRLLVDDIYTTVKDKDFILLDQHPNIEIRIFNPINRDGFYWLNFVGTMKETNRRMHNKSFTADNAFSVVGGRNIGNTYFALEKSTIYADFDILAIGPVANQVSESFDKYWNFERTVPVKYLNNKPKETLDDVRARVGEDFKSAYNKRYRSAVDSDVIRRAEKNLDFIVGDVQMLEDDPSKVMVPPTPSEMKLLNQLVPKIKDTQERLVIISPYFIPGDAGVDILKTLVDNGKTVIVITNSLATNNHASAQGAYTKYRKDLIRAGVQLHELRHSALKELQTDPNAPDDLHMHVKLMFIDDQYVFAGSLNLDPRSFNLNTEGGLLINSKELSDEMLKNLDSDLPVITYRVKLDDEDRVRWHGIVNGEPVVVKHAPETSVFKRIGKTFLLLVPQGQL